MPINVDHMKKLSLLVKMRNKIWIRLLTSMLNPKDEERQAFILAFLTPYWKDGYKTAIEDQKSQQGIKCH